MSSGPNIGRLRVPVGRMPEPTFLRGVPNKSGDSRVFSIVFHAQGQPVWQEAMQGQLQVRGGCSGVWRD